MRFALHPEARAEFVSAIEHYEHEEPGLGYDFSIEVMNAIVNAMEFPTAWPVVEGDIRKCPTRRFPYNVLYSLGDETILILAVMHQHRQPGYWQHRR